VTLIEGRFVASLCSGMCGRMVYTVPAYIGSGRCVGCARAWFGVDGVRPATWVRGEPWPSGRVDRRNWELEAAAARRGERAGRPVVPARKPEAGDGLPIAFWDLASVFGAIGRVGAWEVWRPGDSRTERETGWWRQWRAGVAVPRLYEWPKESRRWEVTYWRCWDGDGEKWVRLPMVVRRGCRG
jgi:hypothetical protein